MNEESGRDIVLPPLHDEPYLAVEQGVLVFLGEALGDLDEAARRQRNERNGRCAVC